MTIAVCEDDPALRSVLARSVKAAGHDVVVARTGGEALRLFPTLSPDVVILDIGLPDSDGRDVCLALRAGGLAAPVLFLTARDGVHDKVAGFESGGDDYLTKPFELPELLVRISALARRAGAAAAPPEGLHLDPARHAVTAHGTTVPLTPTEFRLLAKLLATPEHVVRRHALVAAGWPMGAAVHDNTLDSYMARLRRKLDVLDRGGPVHRHRPRRGLRVAVNLGLRGRLVATTVAAALAAVTVLVVGLQLLLAHQSSRDSLTTLEGRADAAATTVRFAGGRARVLETPADSLDQNIWIYDATGRRIDGAEPPRRLRAQVARLSSSATEQDVVVDGGIRVLARPVPRPGRGRSVRWWSRPSTSRRTSRPSAAGCW